VVVVVVLARGIEVGVLVVDALCSHVITRGCRLGMVCWMACSNRSVVWCVGVGEVGVCVVAGEGAKLSILPSLVAYCHLLITTPCNN
jgi:hypothetical protein